MNIDKLFEEGLSFINIRRNLGNTPINRPLVVDYVATVRMGGDAKAVSATHAEPAKAFKRALAQIGLA